MDDDASPNQDQAILQIIRAHPAGITDDDIRAQLKSDVSDRTVHRRLRDLEEWGDVEHFPDPTDRRKVLYRTRDARVSPPAEEKRSPFTVHGSPIPPNPNHPETAAESPGGDEPSQEEPGDVPDTGALQAQAFAELQARAVREVVRDVVLHLVPPQGVAGMAQNQAAILHWNTAETAALIAEVQQVLPRVTAENAAEYGLVPAQVTAWATWCGGSSAALHATRNAETETRNTSADLPSPTKASAASSTGAGNGKIGKPENKRPPKPPTTTTETRPIENRDSKIENPDTPQSAIRSPQSSQTLTAGLNALIDRYAPDLPPALRPLVISAALVLLSAIVVLTSTTATATVSAHPKTALIVFSIVGLSGFMWLDRKRRVRAAASLTATDDLGAQPPSAAISGSVVAAVRDRDVSDPGSRSAAVTDRGYNSHPRRRVTTIAAVVLVAAIVAIVWYWRTPSRPSDVAISAYLEQTTTPLPVRVVSVTPTYTAISSVSCSFTYQAVFETTAPLYRRVDTAEYLKSQISNFKSAGSAPVLVTTSTPPGTTALATGMIIAWRRDASWVFTPQQGGFDRSRFEGEPKPAGAFAVDDPADLVRLNTLLAEQATNAAKADAAAAAAAAERERTRQQQNATFAQLLDVGTLFVGELTDPVRGVPQRVVLEITSSSATRQQLSVALRNDGGWTDARPFTGTWSLNGNADAAVMTLKTGGRDAIDSAGPLLQDRLDLALMLEFSADGSAVAAAGGGVTDLKSQISNLKSGGYAPSLRRIDPADAAAVREAILRPIAPAIAATQFGKLYRGTATSRTAHTTEPLRLRFVGGSNDPAKPITVTATLESTTVAGVVRPLRGTIISNTYRVANAPIQLVTEDRDRVARGGANSALSFATGNGFKPALRVEGERIVGEDPYFTYAFAPEVGNSEERETGSMGNAGAKNPPATAPIENRDSKIENPLPPFPAAAGAYLLVDGAWRALPHNNANVLKNFVQKANGFFGTLNRIEDELAGKTSAPSTDVVGDLIFSGRDEVPVARSGEVVIAYVGPLVVNPKLLAKYPLMQLEDVYCVMELAPLKPMNNGNRYTPMSTVFGDISDFGPRRLPTTVATVGSNVTLLRCTAALPAGGYALACLAQYYELAVK